MQEKMTVQEIAENNVISNWVETLEPFQDEYFKGLDTKQIAELAKKSIRLTTENRKLEAVLDEIKEIASCSDCVPCLEDICDCEKCEDECTDNGARCMQYGLEKILDIISKATGEL